MGRLQAKGKFALQSTLVIFSQTHPDRWKAVMNYFTIHSGYILSRNDGKRTVAHSILYNPLWLYSLGQTLLLYRHLYLLYNPLWLYSLHRSHHGRSQLLNFTIHSGYILSPKPSRGSPPIRIFTIHSGYILSPDGKTAARWCTCLYNPLWLYSLQENRNQNHYIRPLQSTLVLFSRRKGVE